MSLDVVGGGGYWWWVAGWYRYQQLSIVRTLTTVNVCVSDSDIIIAGLHLLVGWREIVGVKQLSMNWKKDEGWRRYWWGLVWSCLTAELVMRDRDSYLVWITRQSVTLPPPHSHSFRDWTSLLTRWDVYHLSPINWLMSLRTWESK